MYPRVASSESSPLPLVPLPALAPRSESSGATIGFCTVILPPKKIPTERAGAYGVRGLKVELIRRTCGYGRQAAVFFSSIGRFALYLE